MTLKKKRVVLIGPVLPFRGGIAQHTTMLHRAMTGSTECLTLSFSRQYPGWLFPGESDRDASYEGHLEPGAEYLIDSLNPLSWRRAVKRTIVFQPEVVVIPWWTAFWSPCFGYITTALVRLGIEVVFLCHNVVEHESTDWKSWLTRQVLSRGTRFIVHTHEDEINLTDLLPRAMVAVHPHPIYHQFPAPNGNLARRRNLELLFYGFVRQYKGLDLLIKAMGQLKGLDIQLTIAGEFWNGEEEAHARIDALGIRDQVEVRAWYHSDQETAELFERAHAIVLPYQTATGSGVVPIAYHYNRPVISTRVGGLLDVVHHGKTGFLVKPGDENDLAEVLRKLSPSSCEAMHTAIKELKSTMSWEGLAQVVIG
ncbi:glycosyltransferase [Gammaproteobacteria bacterium]|nr:glycosyltransferase [Gammaproteobacteria bacterium]